MTEKEDGFLSRWSRKKSMGSDSIDDEIKVEKLVEQPQQGGTASTDVDDVPVWQQDDVDAETKKKALSALFTQPEFNDVDNLNEYDEDFTSFTGLGDIVTAEMKRMLRLAEEKTRPQDVTEDKIQDIAHSSVEKNDEKESDKDNEEDKLA